MGGPSFQKRAFGQCTRQTRLHYYIMHARDLRQQVQEGDQSIVLLCHGRSVWGPCSIEYMLDWSKVQAFMHQGRILVEGGEHILFF
jgi:hypothetical protein